MKNDIFGKSSIAIELYNWIRENIKDGSTILELGSGRVTGELSKNYTMISVEHDKDWVGKYNSSYIYIYAPIKQYSGYKWYDIDVLKKRVTKVI